jgi:nucleotide-binding universal stress UspA family protein
MFKRILHPTDFSPVSYQAFDHAVALSLRHGAELQLLHALILYEFDKSIVDGGFSKLAETYGSICTQLKNQMAKNVEQSDIGTDRCSWSVGRGLDAGTVILDHAEESGSDLIVMGTHGHSPVRRFFMGSVAEKVVRYASCPVMVLGVQAVVPERLGHILLPVDSSPASHRAADVAIELAKEHNAKLHLVHVYQDIVPPVYYVYSVNALEYYPGLKKRGEDALGKFMAHHDLRGVELQMHLVDGRIPRSIVDLSNQESIDLIVMGTAGLTGIRHFMLSSITEKVLRNADVPVMTVRAASEEKGTRGEHFVHETQRAG